VPDLLFQRWQFKESLKMSREAFKEELKQDEGNPEVRRRLKSRYREILSRNMINAVPNADVVITNPTHYSVALEVNWEEINAGRSNGPKVIAKGEDDLAFRIREVAEANGVPVVRHPPLTRLLYQETEVGDEIPARYYKIVADLVGVFFTYEEKQKKARRASEKSGGSSGRMGA
jgi:flagellar biosynthetic protein FlhB